MSRRIRAGDLRMADWIRAGDGIVWAQASAEPVLLTRLLVEQAPQIGHFTCFLGVTVADAFAPPPGATVLAYGAGGRNRAWSRSGRLTVLPTNYSALPRALGTTIPADVVMLMVPPADDQGRHHVGLADEYLSAAIDRARVVMVEESPHVPRIPNSRLLPADRIAVVVPTDTRPPALQQPDTSEVERTLAARVAELVPDGATLQVGLGALPGAILASLREHHDLGVHSGLINDGIADLVRRGVVTNARKPFDTGVSIAGVLMGTSDLFQLVDGDPRFALRPTTYTHDPAVLGSLPALTTINSALEIDLSGQVNTEVAGGHYVGAVGGALDFLRGAHRSPGGLPLVALTSTTSSGRSRIVPRLSGPVTIPRADIGIVVTEHGAVDLRDRTLEQRRQLMLSIANPELRADIGASHHPQEHP